MLYSGGGSKNCVTWKDWVLGLCEDRLLPGLVVGSGVILYMVLVGGQIVLPGAGLSGYCDLLGL